MSDEALRALERQILAEPTQHDLRRQHARLLQRAGDEDRALAALDLAWRLGAEELWTELAPALEARRKRVAGMTLCYVPGGPFAMGADDQDADAAPLHLVHLSAHYVAEEPLQRGNVEGWLRRDQWPFIDDGPYRERNIQWHLAQPVLGTHSQALDAIATLDRTAQVDGLTGRWAMITEAQWERVFRAALLRKDGLSPYGPRLDRERPEWTADRYDPAAYGAGPRRDPTGPALRATSATGPSGGRSTFTEGDPWVVRGVPGLPPELRPLYREAAREDGYFEVQGRWGSRWVPHEQNVAVRAVFLPGPAA